MVKHTQAISRQIADELFEYVWPFCGVCAERFKVAHSEKKVLLLYSSVIFTIETWSIFEKSKKHLRSPEYASEHNLNWA